MKVKEVKLRDEAGNHRTMAKMKSKAPWVPPGRASIRDISHKWEGHKHRLEETTPLEQSPTLLSLHMSDLSSEEEELLHGRINQYEKKIESLMAEVGSLKNQAELRKKEQLQEHQTDHLNTSKHGTEENKEELGEVAKELEITERENNHLQNSLEKMGFKTQSRQEIEASLQDKDVLLKKLVEAEMDGAAAAKQASALQETVGRAGTLTRSDATLLARQKDQLMQKLEMFQGTNQALRHLLRKHHERLTETTRFSEQKRVLLKKLADTEAENAYLVAKLQEKEKEVEDIATSLESEKENMKTTRELSKALESTRTQLQQQLHSKEAENGNLVVQIQQLERTVHLRAGEVEQLHAQLSELRQRSGADREALRSMTRAQKQQAQRSQDTESQLVDALAAVESWRSRHSQREKEKTQLEMEISLLNNRLTDLQDRLHSAEDKARTEREGLLDRLHHLTSDSTATRLENQRLRANMSVLEEKLTTAQCDVQKLKTSLSQCEGLVDSYRNQLHEARMETHECSVKLELAEKEAQSARLELEEEVGALRRQLTQRLSALQLLPDRLKRSELQRREAEEQVRVHERRHSEQSGALAELRLKMEQQGNQVEAFRQKNVSLQNDIKRLKQTAGTLEKKLEEANSQNKELLQVIAKREETIHSNQVRLEEKTQECSSLTRQLEAVLGGVKWQQGERSPHSKVLDLETQLSISKTEVAQLQRSKEEAEYQLQKRIEDMKERVDNLDSTNRSLQTYVQFLKTSYTNVFGNSVITSSLVEPTSQV